MLNTFDRNGVRFDYPANWQAEYADVEGGWSVTVGDGGPSFLWLVVNEDCLPTEQVAADALASLREEYPTLDAEPAAQQVAGYRAAGHDIDFITLDTTVSCRTRCFACPAGTVLVMTQSPDQESIAGDVFRAVIASLTVNVD